MEIYIAETTHFKIVKIIESGNRNNIAIGIKDPINDIYIIGNKACCKKSLIGNSVYLFRINKSMQILIGKAVKVKQ